MEFTRESFNRIEKLLLDGGDAETPEQAKEKLAQFQVSIVVGPEHASSVPHQVALLTLAALATRACPGGVRMVGVDMDAPLVARIMPGTTVGDAIRRIPGVELGRALEATPVLHLGETDGKSSGPLNLRCTFGNWNGCVAPVDEGVRLAEDDACPLSATLAAGLAIGEVFQYHRARFGHRWSNIEAGYRVQGMSLWDPAATKRWASIVGPDMRDLVLPDGYWLLGLGHLGQAYAWGMSTIPFSDRAVVRLILNDAEDATESNVSTSVLTKASEIGAKKTRYLAAHLDSLGFQTEIVERHFDGNFVRADSDPSVLLCGVDNLPTRRGLETPKFPVVVDAGLGGSSSDYLQMSIRRFPSNADARKVYEGDDAQERVKSLLSSDVYKRLASRVDKCGLERVAGASVGVPFVGAVASSIVLSWALRAHSGLGPAYHLSASLDDLNHRKVTPRATEDGI